MNKYLKSMLDPPKSLEEASNDIQCEFIDELTEYGYAKFIHRLPNEFTDEDYNKCYREALLDQSLDKLIKLGMVEELFDPEKNEPVYKLTDKGKEYAKLGIK
jgi:DNA-binding PadR family transcriptional regulator